MEKKCPLCRKKITLVELEKRRVEKFPPVCDNCVEPAKEKLKICQTLMEKMSL